MADLMQQAHELLAVEYERDGLPEQAKAIRAGSEIAVPARVLRAIAAALRATPAGYALVPVEPTPERMAAAALAVLAPANGDMELARRAAQIVIQSADAPHGITVDVIAASIATMAPAYRAMTAARPQGVKDAG